MRVSLEDYDAAQREVAHLSPRAKSPQVVGLLTLAGGVIALLIVLAAQEMGIQISAAIGLALAAAYGVGHQAVKLEMRRHEEALRSVLFCKALANEEEA